MTVEEEIKVPVPSLEAVRGRLAEQGARLVRARTLERNWVLDDEHGTLRASGRLLRLRSRGEESLVTVKGPASFSGPVKRREETETRVGDVDAALAVFAGLGYRVVRRYEKYREEWEIAGVAVVLDETPAGDYVEAEGPAALLEATLRGAGLDPAGAVSGTYLDIWQAYRRRHPDAPEDMVFE